MNIVVFGANGPTGQHVAKQALAEGHAVTAVTRHPRMFPLRHERLTVQYGDVFDPAAVEQAVAGQDAVLSSLGVPFSRKPIAVSSVSVRAPPVPTMTLGADSSSTECCNRSLFLQLGRQPTRICGVWRRW